MKEWNEIVIKRQQSILKICSFLGRGVCEGHNQLLIFCDGTNKAYAVVVHLRIKDGHEYQINILYFKFCLVPS